MAEKKKVLVRKSAVKTHKQSEKARVRHKSRRNTISTTELLKTQYAALDKAVKSGTFHKNKADRKKSRLASLVNSVAKKAEAPAS